MMVRLHSFPLNCFTLRFSWERASAPTRLNSVRITGGVPPKARQTASQDPAKVPNVRKCVTRFDSEAFGQVYFARKKYTFFLRASGQIRLAALVCKTSPPCEGQSSNLWAPTRFAGVTAMQTCQTLKSGVFVGSIPTTGTTRQGRQIGKAAGLKLPCLRVRFSPLAPSQNNP